MWKNTLRTSALLALLGLTQACGGSDDGGAIENPADCEAELDYFRTQVWDPILSTKCIGCHTPEGPAQNSRMKFKREGDKGWLEHNYAQLAGMATEQLDGTALLLLKPTGQHPGGHTGGELIPVGSEDYGRIAGFVDRVTSDECIDDGPTVVDCREYGVLPGRRTLRRLTRTEYDNTVRDLVGLDMGLGQGFATDTVINGFDNHTEALTVSPLLADQLAAAAETLSLALNMGSLLPCDPGQLGETDCAKAFIEDFGARAFRRPMRAEDTARYMTVYAAGSAGADFESGVRLVLESFLQSPHFLYRSELGEPVGDGTYRLTAFEIASELSYLIWGTMPDAALFTAAQDGTLDTQEGIETQAKRMLEDPRARTAVQRFVSQWLDLDQLEVVPKDEGTFPEFDKGVRAAMRAELNHFIDRVVFEEEGSFGTLLTAPYTFANETLAALYGVPPGATTLDDGFSIVTPESPARSGILTLGPVIATHSRPNGSSPVHRGLLVRERVLCQELPPPPPGVNAEPPALDPNATARERYRAHSEEQPCLGCHRLIDPIGFAFEHFDGIGRYRETDNGNAIDATGEIVSTEASDTTFDGTEALVTHLGTSPDSQGCFVTQWFRYAYAIEEDAQTSCGLDALKDTFVGSDMSVQSLILELTKTPHFTTRFEEDAAEGGEPSPGEDNPGAPNEAPPTDEAPGEEPAPAPEGLKVEVVTDSSWATGRCDKVFVTNSSSNAQAWRVTLTIDGTLTNHWNAEASAATGDVTFTGVAWNRELAAGETTDFGYCLEQ